MASHKNRDDETYERGVRDGQNADFKDQAVHNLTKGWSFSPRETGIYNKGFDYGVAHRPERESRSSERERHSGGGGGGGRGERSSGRSSGWGDGGDNGFAGLIVGAAVVMTIVGVVLWFIFAVVIPLLVINLAVIALLLAGLGKPVSKFLLPLSVAGAALVVADYNQGWLTKGLVDDVAFFARAIPVFLYLNITAGLVAAYFLIRNVLNRMSPLEDGSGEFTTRNVMIMVSLMFVGALTLGFQRAVDSRKAILRDRIAAQAADEVRLAEAVRIAERSRVEQGIVGQWSSGASRLTITKDGDTFRAEYPTQNSRGSLLATVAGLQRLHGEILHDNCLRLGNVNSGKLLNPALGYYDGDFSQTVWIRLSGDGSSLTVRFDQVEGGRLLVMNRLAEKPALLSTSSVSESAKEEPKPQRAGDAPKIADTPESISIPKPSVAQSLQTVQLKKEPPQLIIPKRQRHYGSYGVREPGAPKPYDGFVESPYGSYGVREEGSPKPYTGFVESPYSSRGVGTPHEERSVPQLSGKDIFEISNLDEPPEPKLQVPPRYPVIMKRDGVTGEVIVDFFVDTSGDVRSVSVVKSTRHEFEAAAVEAVSKWKFSPGRKGNRDVVTHMQMPIVFSR